MFSNTVVKNFVAKSDEIFADEVFTDKVVKQDNFSFKPISKADIGKEVRLLTPKKQLLVTMFHLKY